LKRSAFLKGGISAGQSLSRRCGNLATNFLFQLQGSGDVVCMQEDYGSERICRMSMGKEQLTK
jgi:hypothetical protein